MELKITSSVLNKIVNTCNKRPNKESCGILLGNKKENFANEFVEIENITDEYIKHVDYIMNPNQLMSYLQKTTFVDKNAKKDWVGIWHSHPRNLGIPSSVDLDRAEYNVVYLIYGMLDGQVMCWTYNKEKNNFRRINYSIEEGI